MSNPKPVPNQPNSPAPLDPQTQKLLAVSAQLGSFFFPILAPLAIYIAASDKFVRDHAREALNFDLVVIIYAVLPVIGFFGLGGAISAGSAGIAILIGFLSMIVIFFLGITFIVYPIIGAVKAASGQTYRFPFIIRLLR